MGWPMRETCGDGESGTGPQHSWNQCEKLVGVGQMAQSMKKRKRPSNNAARKGWIERRRWASLVEGVDDAKPPARHEAVS
jgi:hypothetical protein